METPNSHYVTMPHCTWEGGCLLHCPRWDFTPPPLDPVGSEQLVPSVPLQPALLASGTLLTRPLAQKCIYFCREPDSFQGCDCFGVKQ